MHTPVLWTLVHGRHRNKTTVVLTRHNLHGIYADGIDVNLSDGVDNVPRFVETLEPEDPREVVQSQ